MVAKEEIALQASNKDRRDIYSIQKEIRKMYLSEKFPKCYLNTCGIRQLIKLKSVIVSSRQLLLESLIDDTEDELSRVLKYQNLNQLFDDDHFIKLLTRESITNRLEKFCQSQTISTQFVERINICILAYKLYELNLFV